MFEDHRKRIKSMLQGEETPKRPTLQDLKEKEASEKSAKTPTKGGDPKSTPREKSKDFSIKSKRSKQAKPDSGEVKVSDAAVERRLGKKADKKANASKAQASLLLKNLGGRAK